MKSTLGRVLRIYPNEVGLTLTLGFLLLSNSIAQQIAGVVGFSGFLSESMPNGILIVWVIIYVSIAVVAVLQTLIIDRFNRAKLMQWLCVGFALIFLALRLMFILPIPTVIPYSLLYIMSDQQWLTFPVAFWILANDTVDMATAKRLFPLIAGVGFVGKLIGIVIAGLSPSILRQFSISPVEVLSVIVVLYILAFAITRWRFRNFRTRTRIDRGDSVGKIVTEAWDFVQQVPMFRYLAIAVAALMACSVIIEFYFTVFSKASIPGEENYQTFYSGYRLGLTLISFAVQTFFASRIISRMNIQSTFLILPVTVMAALVGAIAWPGLLSAIVAMIAYKLPRETIDESAQKALRTVIPEERQGRVSLFMDSILVGGSAVVACLVMGVIVWVGPSLFGTQYYYIYLGLGVILAGVGLWAVLNVRKVYDSSLLNWRLKRRKSGSSVLDKLDF